MLKPILENEIVNNMENELVKVANNRDFSDLEKAADYINSAMHILDDTGFAKQSDQLLLLLKKIAAKRKPKNPLKISNRHTKNLTSNKMIKNLKDHGTVFNMPDNNMADDLLDADIDFEEES